MQIASRLLGLWLLGITLGVAHADVADDGGGGSTDGTGDDGTAGDDGSPGDDGSGGDTAASADDDGGCGSKDDAALTSGASLGLGLLLLGSLRRRRTSPTA
jgi:hypothetical protein